MKLENEAVWTRNVTVRECAKRNVNADKGNSQFEKLTFRNRNNRCRRINCKQLLARAVEAPASTGNIQNKNNHNVVYIVSSIANGVLGNAPKKKRRDEVDAVQPEGKADTRVIGHKPTPQGNRKPPPGTRSRSKTAQDLSGLSGFPARFERFERFGRVFWKNRSNRSNLA